MTQGDRILDLPKTRIIQDLGLLRFEALVDADEREQAQLVVLKGFRSKKKVLLYSLNWVHILPPSKSNNRQLVHSQLAPPDYEAIIDHDQQGRGKIQLYSGDSHVLVRVNSKYLSLMNQPEVYLTDGDLLQFSNSNIFMRYESVSTVNR